MSAQDAAMLRAARTRLTPDGAWTQWVYARDASNQEVFYDSPKAVSWCLAGAFFAEGHIVPLEIRVGFPSRSATTWNDAPGRTQAEVLAFLDARIAEAEASA